MKLHFSPTSPYVRKCLVVAHELGLADQLSLLASNAHPVNRDASIIANNPLGKVPALITDDGQVLYDSRVICEYLNELGGGKLFPAPGPARWQALTLQSLGDGILDAALLARYEGFVRPENLRWSDWTAGKMDAIRTSLTALEKTPQALTGDLDIGVITIACALLYLDLRFPELAWRTAYPATAQAIAPVLARASMTRQWTLPA